MGRVRVNLFTPDDTCVRSVRVNRLIRNDEINQ